LPGDKGFGAIWKKQNSEKESGEIFFPPDIYTYHE